MIIVGLNAYHGDSSACLIRDGQLIAAAEEERFRRVKHWAGFPSEAIRYCLAEAGASLSDVEHIALNSDPRASLLKKISYALLRRPDIGFVISRLYNQAKRQSVASMLAGAFPGTPFRGTVHRVEHHLAHLASCFLVAPYRDAVAVSIDGFGDFASTAWGVGRGAELRIEGRVHFPHSLGIFYQALTQHLGFPHYGDEYKVMGLAPYGEPRYMPEMRQVVRLQDDGTFRLDLRFFRHHREKVDYRWDGGAPSVGALYSQALCELLGPARAPFDPIEQRHRDLARSVQGMYEEAFFHLLNMLYPQYGLENLTLAGGCAMNSVANGKVRRMTPFRRLYIQAAAGDAGGAIGAATAIWQRVTGCRGSTMEHAYWGPQFGENDVGALLDEQYNAIVDAGCAVQKFDEATALCQFTAEAIAQGKVVGWFQGRMEWGPRALGNRSIVCDPRRPDMKDILNAKIKRRESFRPFAPSILDKAVSDWFEEDDDVPFMMQVFQVRRDKRALIPAVAHVDGSGRLQTVHQRTNPLYYSLIEKFEALTGIPMVLNTSFNENEPVVCKPSEALDCFLRTNMDMLVLGSVVVKRT